MCYVEFNKGVNFKHRTDFVVITNLSDDRHIKNNVNMVKAAVLSLFVLRWHNMV